MSLIGILIAGAIIGALVLTLYIDYVTESSLRESISGELPQSMYADVERISNEYGKEYGKTYYLKAHNRDGSTKKVEVKCKGGNVSNYARIRI